MECLLSYSKRGAVGSETVCSAVGNAVCLLNYSVVFVLHFIFSSMKSNKVLPLFVDAAAPAGTIVIIYFP